MKELQINKWYYDIPKEEFLKIIHQYPLVPFFVHGASKYVSGLTFRSNQGILESEGIDGVWRKGDLSEVVDDESNVDFIVFSSSFINFVKETQCLDSFHVLLRQSDSTKESE
jgi:hypothetical protein